VTVPFAACRIKWRALQVLLVQGWLRWILT
jgi:hypothetical protein